LQSNHYDVVHTHDGHLTGMTAWMCKKYFDGPIICHAHTTKCVNPKHRPFMPIFRWMSRTYGEFLVGCGEKACQYCFGTKKQYEIVHNAVDVSRFQKVTEEEVVNLKERLDIPQDAFIIGHVGAFGPPKNHKYLLRVFEGILSKDKANYLVLVGDGELKDSMIELCQKMKIEDHVRFVGKQTNIEIYMKLFHVFVLPSFHEGLPVVGIEAQASGLKCILSDRIDRSVDAGLGLVRFVPIDEEALEEWEEEICKPYVKPDDSIIFDLLSKNGYEIESSARDLVNIYQRIVSDRNR